MIRDPQTGSTQQSSEGRDYIYTLPYEGRRVEIVCNHSPLYLMKNEPEQPLFCGLCFFKIGWTGEIPAQIHLSRTLAENGNPESNPKFIAHLYLVMGLKPPKKDEPLHIYRRKRGSLKNNPPRAREQYTSPAWGLFPVASSLWQLMGYQPPLGIALVKAIGGRSEQEIARELDESLVNIYIRIAKAIRTAMGYFPRDKQQRNDPVQSRRDDRPDPKPVGAN